MAKTIRILQVGGKDKSAGLSLPEKMEWYHVSLKEDLEAFLQGHLAALLVQEAAKDEQKHLVSQQQQTKKAKALQARRQFDALLIMSTVDEAQLEPLDQWVEAHCVFYAADLSLAASYRGFLRRKMARPLDLLTQGEASQLITFLHLALFKGQYGDKLQVNDIDVFPGFPGQVSFQGHASLTFEGDFGEELTPLFTFKYGISMDKIATELWWEYVSDGAVTLAIAIDSIYAGAIDGVKASRMVSGTDLEQPILLYPDAEVGQYNVTVYAKGQGKLIAGPLHRRLSHLGLGELLVGGQIHRDAKRQEVLSYFHPGDMKPPLSVYFSGFRAAEGFEGFYMMKKIGSPFLLLSDPRLEGGSFYQGSPAYQAAIVKAIQTALDYLGFDHSQLILSGISMGTYGALYYATILQPHTVIVGKPFTNIGDAAMNLRLLRPDEFEASADMLLALVGDNHAAAVQKINAHFWQAFKPADFSKTQFAIAYMLNEDYDPKAYERLLDYAADKQIHLFSKGYLGRHNDNSDAITKWFVDQYQTVLANDFERSKP